MPSPALIEFLVESAVLYAVLGMVFGVAFAWRGAAAIDPVARHATLGFRVLVVPGAALLWPMLAARWWRVVTAEAGAPEVPGDRTDIWSPASERLRARALALWLALVPVIAAAIVVALSVRRPAAGNSPDADRLPAVLPHGSVSTEAPAPRGAGGAR